eukprot:8184965-Heterocapsa_arctica.AAC.1
MPLMTPQVCVNTRAVDTVITSPTVFRVRSCRHAVHSVDSHSLHGGLIHTIRHDIADLVWLKPLRSTLSCCSHGGRDF